MKKKRYKIKKLSSIRGIKTVVGFTYKLATLVLAGVALALPATGAGRDAAGYDKQTPQEVAGTREIRNADGTYRIRADDNTLSRPRQASKLIQLRRAPPFDPLTGVHLTLPQRLTSPAPDLYRRDTANVVDAYIIQFHTQALPAYQRALQAAGVEIVTALPPNAVVGLMDKTTRAAIESRPFVRATVDYLPAYKLQQGLENRIAAAGADLQTYSIMSVSKSHRAALVRFTESIGGIVLKGDPAQTQRAALATSVNDGSRFSAKLNAAQLLQVSRRPETLFIDLRGEESEDLGQVREREEFDYIEQVAGYCGRGVGIEVYDRGFRLSHQELVNKSILVRSPAASGSGGLNHGTEIAGILYADGIAMSSGLLRCAARPIVFSRFSAFPGNNRPTESQLRGHLAELVDPAGDYRAVVQTSSTDYSTTTNYTTWSAEYDEVLFELDLVKLQSQSNTGNRNSRPAAWAKNVVAVGGFDTNNTVERSDDSWGSASIGPAADNRIKPDLSGQYGGIRTIDDASNTAYRNFGGTSGATPTVAGAFGIMFEMWADGVFAGGPGQNRDVFDARPHAATAKALMIHSAYRYAFSGGDNANMSRVHQGWGAPDLRNLYDTARDNGWRLPILVDEQDVLTPGGTNSYALNVDGSQPLKATLVYRDLRGNPAAAIHRINDLSLKVTSPAGTVYWGNNGLRNGNWSTPGGSSNTIDTVENVFIQTPAAGTWSIEVLGDDIVLDGHPPTATTDAVYALVASGGSAGPAINRAPRVNAGVNQTVVLPNAATLNGEVSDDGLPEGAGITTAWSRVSGPGTVNFGNAAAVDTSASASVAGTYVLRLSADDTELSASDDIQITFVDAGTPVVLEAEDFENGLGNWRNVSTGDDEDWTRDAGGTASNRTGPDSGNNGSQWYTYLETSDGRGAFNAGDTAILEGPSVGGAARTLSFFYHMYGSDMGTLNVDVYSDGAWDEGVWSISGQQQNDNDAAYTPVSIDLGSFSGPLRVRFRAVADGGFRGDMAIDDIEITGLN
ncbi:PKD domain-containing protein [Exilibacterium tricleocarpae]|uniref:PKD domain-containing protein n=1 Tax=Exilibacterium tricleocarpae TaxID=2591008 RepID=UPI0015D1C6B6|nr:S8 family serine peptidase [Exilibacterium tricleocarpae]